MRNALFALTWTFLLFPRFSLSQTIKENTAYTKVDSFSRTVRYKTDIYRLTKELTDPYTDQRLKTRSIFIWVTDNIKYDFKFFNKGAEIKSRKCTTEENCEQVRLEWEKTYINKIIKKKKTVCDGYARLFKKMCDIAGIRCEMVAGYTRSKPYQIGNPGFVNHAWNVVWVDSAWHFVDPTWAAGGCEEDEETGKLLFFTKNYNDYYWFTSFEDLSRNHYPQEEKWVLEPAYTKERYAANPYYAPWIITDLKLLSPATGILKAVTGDTLHFKFTYPRSLNALQINSNVFRNPSIWEEEKRPWHRKTRKLDTIAVKRQQYIPFKNNGDTYEFDYIVADASLYFLDILFDRRTVMRFNVEINGVPK